MNSTNSPKCNTVSPRLQYRIASIHLQRFLFCNVAQTRCESTGTGIETKVSHIPGNCFGPRYFDAVHHW